MSGAGVPAGWYPDPSGTGGLRWYDGSGWTTDTAPPPSTPAALLAGSRPARSKGSRLVVRGLLISAGAFGALFAEIFAFAMLASSAGSPVAGGDPNAHSLSGPLGLVTGIVFVLTFLAIPGGLVVAVVGLVAAAATRRERVDAARQQLAQAREYVSDQAGVSAVQAAPIPGRSWRTLVTGAWWLAPLAVFAIAVILSQPVLAIAAFVAELVLLAIRSSISRKRGKATTAAIAEAAGLPPDLDGRQILAARSDAVRAVALAAGWQYVGDPPPDGLDLVVRDLGVADICSGTVDGDPFFLFDALQLVETVPMGDNDPHDSTVSIRQARTLVQQPFPAVFRLAAVQGTPAETFPWSDFGAAIDLESAEFNARFQVYCDDPVRALLVLNPSVMEVLLQAPFRVGVLIQNGVFQVMTPDTLAPAPVLAALVATTSRLRRSARSAVADLPGAPASTLARPQR